MEVLVSNRLRHHRRYGRFDTQIDQCLTRATTVQIATGYISREAVAHLTRHIREEPAAFDSVDLWIGMAGPTSLQQCNAAMVLNETLAEYGIGGVHVVSDWPYHGKVYLFGDSAGLFGGSVGSSNLTAIVDPHNLVELDFYVEQQEMLTQLEDFIDDTLRPASISIEEYDRILDDGDKRYSEKFDFYADFGDSPLSIFDGVLAVSDIELADIRGRLRLPEFTHRLKTADSSPRRTPKSNINAYHGKPRLRRSRTGDFLVPRPWYEFEIILGVNEMNDPSCPPSGDFQVVTDDGYSFSCRRQGDPPELGGKNIRSTGTLLILGKWVKGRLEEAGALRPGELVTDATLGAYGRDHIAFSRIDGEDNRWYLDFSIPQGR